MPKASPLQESFSGGEFSARVQGRVGSERYKTGLATCLNYLPTIQGPLIRRPGMKYVGNDAKDPSKPPAFLDFKFSATQNYVLEFGDLYVRFYTNNGQITTTSTNFKVAGTRGTVNVSFNSALFYAMRTSPISLPGETVLSSSVILASSILEIGSPYSYADVFNLKTSQKDDTLFIVHSSYPEYKLQRLGGQNWDLKQVLTQDGPYLPLNTYRQTGDSERVQIIAHSPSIIYGDSSSDYTVNTGPVVIVGSAINNGAGLIRIFSTSHGLVSGDRVVIKEVPGTVEANNGTSSISAMFWRITRIDDNNFDLQGSAFVHNMTTGSGKVFPALFEPYIDNTVFNDNGRVIALYRIPDAGRAWGRISRVIDMSQAVIHVDATASPLIAGSSTNLIVLSWQMGPWNRSNGYPGAICFHQDRMALGGVPQYPQRLDLSVSSDYENFAPSSSSNIIANNNALSFGLNSDQLNRIFWMKSDTQGLLAGSLSSEWNVTPNNQASALTPTNIDAKQTSFYGSADADAIQTGNATLYIQRARRRVRELNYFFQVNTYRSTDLAELSDHITNPSLSKLQVQKESIALVWGLRTDGQLVSMSYSRDDTTLKAGWARHQLGGRSDSGNSPPVVKTMSVIPSPDGTFDQVWVATQRFINGTSVLNIEYMTKPFDDSFNQEDAFQLDCGATYNSPITITAITTGSAVVTAAAHGFSNGDSVKINAVVGLNSSIVDVNGIIANSNLVNGRVFRAGSVSANAFFLTDINNGSSFVDSRSYSAYFSGGEARKLVSTISGLTWLKNETVAVLADGGIHPTAVVNSAGVLSLSYPAAKVQIGYAYNSDGQTLRPEAGAGDGTSIGKIRRPVRAAFMLNRTGDFSIGTDFNRLTPLELNNASVQADTATPLFTGIVREGLESEYGFEGQVCFRQNSPLPGMVQTITINMEENDV